MTFTSRGWVQAMASNMHCFSDDSTSASTTSIDDLDHGDNDDRGIDTGVHDRDGGRGDGGDDVGDGDEGDAWTPRRARQQHQEDFSTVDGAVGRTVLLFFHLLSRVSVCFAL